MTVDARPVTLCLRTAKHQKLPAAWTVIPLICRLPWFSATYHICQSLSLISFSCHIPSSLIKSAFGELDAASTISLWAICDSSGNRDPLFIRITGCRLLLTSIAATSSTNLSLLLTCTTIYNMFFVQAEQMFVTGTERDRETDSSLTLFVDFADRMSISLCFFVKGLFNSWHLS